MESVAKGVVSCDSLALPSAIHGVVSQPVTVLAASWARSVRAKNGVTHPVTKCCHKLGGAEEKAETGGRDHREEVPCVRILEADRGKPSNTS